MSLERELHTRSESKCELCGSVEDLKVYAVPFDEKSPEDSHALLCPTCTGQIEKNVDMDPNHWRCLNDSMWSTVPAVQVLAWRMLTRLRPEGWPQDLLDMLYLDDEMMAWAQSTGEGAEEEEGIKHVDSNGVVLNAGDSVVLIKDLPVKGSSLVAKRGTSVRNITLVHDNAEHIEGKVEGQQVVILTKYVKK